VCENTRTPTHPPTHKHTHTCVHIYMHICCIPYCDENSMKLDKVRLDSIRFRLQYPTSSIRMRLERTKSDAMKLNEITSSPHFHQACTKCIDTQHKSVACFFLSNLCTNTHTHTHMRTQIHTHTDGTLQHQDQSTHSWKHRQNIF